ncbi:MAG: hypothetical protein IMF01_07250 [Proteobacteria bacterium]|nr:hypothetical protein [Pseudomonadota bacterium]
MGKRGVRTLRYTLMINKDERVDQTELYDNLEDPYQLNNLSNTSPELVAKLGSELKIWLEKANDPWIKHLEPPKE